MKQILFRGKTETGRWAYGSLILADNYCCILESDDGKATPVIPETVGQFIGRACYDAFGYNQKLFEGDIIAVYRSKRIDIEHGKPDSIAIAVDEHCITENGLGRCFPQDTIQTKVIGNVYDNPELVGEKYAELYKRYFGFEKDETL